jgi:hypothetical protein
MQLDLICAISKIIILQSYGLLYLKRERIVEQQLNDLSLSNQFGCRDPSHMDYYTRKFADPQFMNKFIIGQENLQILSSSSSLGKYCTKNTFSCLNLVFKKQSLAAIPTTADNKK